MVGNKETERVSEEWYRDEEGGESCSDSRRDDEFHRRFDGKSGKVRMEVQDAVETNLLTWDDE